MTIREPNEPERWIVSTDAPPELRALLEVARREGPSLAQKASLGSRLGLSMQQALIGFGGKGVAVTTIVLAAATGAGLGLSSGGRPLESASATRGSLPAEAAALAPIESASSSEPQDVDPMPLALPSTDTETSQAEVKSTAPSAQPKRPSEAALIRSARDVLATNAPRARALLDRHRQLYPSGQLAQEREVLLIEVLRLEGREAEASARAAEFRQKNPDSAHRPAAP